MRLVISSIFILFIVNTYAQEIAFFDRSFHKRSQFKDIGNKRLYFVTDSIVKTEDYKKNRIYRKGRFYGFSNLKNLDAFIRYNASNQYHKFDSLETQNRYGIVDYYNKSEKLIRRELYKENSTKYIQVWNEKGDSLLIKGSGTFTKNYPKTNEKFFQIFKDSVEIASYYVRNIKSDTIFHKVDKRSYPKEGLRNFYQNLAKTINYPGLAKMLGVDKKITIQFTVNESGKLTEFVPISLPSHNFEKRAIKRLEKMPAWYPAILNGKPVKTRFRIPITFRLE